MKKILFVLSLYFPLAASACKYEDIPTSERIGQASQVYFGYVTAISLDSFELQKKKDGLFSAHDIIVGSDSKTYRILIKETLKGKAENVKNVKIEWCGGGDAELGSRVVVYISKNSRYIEPLSEEIYKNIKSGEFNP